MHETTQTKVQTDLSESRPLNMYAIKMGQVFFHSHYQEMREKKRIQNDLLKRQSEFNFSASSFSFYGD